MRAHYQLPSSSWYHPCKYLCITQSHIRNVLIFVEKSQNFSKHKTKLYLSSSVYSLLLSTWVESLVSFTLWVFVWDPCFKLWLGGGGLQDFSVNPHPYESKIGTGASVMNFERRIINITWYMIKLSWTCNSSKHQFPQNTEDYSAGKKHWAIPNSNVS